MILIADSGSTKTDWRIIAKDGSIQQLKTEGFNPYYQSSEEISRVLKTDLLPKITTDISTIYFYGAGCANPDKNAVVKDALQRNFQNCTIEINSDLLAAARATCNHEQGIACILGTGSNSCLFDGNEIVENIRPLGFLLGDEGSGAYLGKMLLVSYLRKELPENLARKFSEAYNTSIDEVLQKVYKEPFPNKYLASFSKFLFDNINEPYVYQLVSQAFETFIKKNVMKYENHENVKVHFVGAIAFYYANVLRQVASDLGVAVKNILETPIAGLTLYHQQKR